MRILTIFRKWYVFFLPDGFFRQVVMRWLITSAQFSATSAVSLICSPFQTLSVPVILLYLIPVNTNPTGNIHGHTISNIIPGAVSDLPCGNYPILRPILLTKLLMEIVQLHHGSKKLYSRDNFDNNVTPSGSISACDQDTLSSEMPASPVLINGQPVTLHHRHLVVASTGSV